MTIEVEIGGRLRRVELDRAEGRWVASIDGRRLAFDAVQVGERWSLLTDSGPPHAEDPRPGIACASYDVQIDDRGRGELAVHVGGERFEARVRDPRAFRRRGQPQGSTGRAGLRQVTAPMPGRVVKVLVKAGESVTARQGLVVVEAMKMENELRAPADAVVRDVKVTQGASVDAGAVLIVLE